MLNLEIIKQNVHNTPLLKEGYNMNTLLFKPNENFIENFNSSLNKIGNKEDVDRFYDIGCGFIEKQTTELLMQLASIKNKRIRELE